MKIGPNLQAVLEAREVPAESICEALGWDAETLSAVLGDRLAPRISELLRLSTFLGVGLSTLLFGREQLESRVVKTAKNERVGVDRKGLLHYESLSPSFAGRHLEPFVIDLYHGSPHDLEVSRHPGEEFLHVLNGELLVTVGGESHHLAEGDSLYFDSGLTHSLQAVTPLARVIAVIYKSESMLRLTKGRGMRSVIEAAKLLTRQQVALACPDHSSLAALNKAIEEGLVDRVYLVGSAAKVREACGSELVFDKRYLLVEVPDDLPDYAGRAARTAVQLVRGGKADMVMKGGINTAPFTKAILDHEQGIGTGRRLSIVSVFELPGVERLIFLTDPAINPELFQHQDPASGIDIIENAIEVARGLGVERPRVALLEANEVPSDKIPTTLLEKALAERLWPDAEVDGPLSYDLALYPEAVEKKGLAGHPVAGRADVLVVPSISGGNFLYKSWAFTMGAEVANVVLGARFPVVMTSRNDSDLTKFLTICVSALHGHFLKRSTAAGPVPAASTP
ncbi:cupin domain-containing protein [Geomonas sp. Red32]|uniref:phosphate acyltransferase n=1 Tax=Geomonas sp. Red32 TaxID=2912856 RepID=UPI00202CCA34|nr:phosphate acyltransferase [Geomonas sp. Red32]MCM0081972.1 cupin domain-containing protein [Geomonas sp. Red32]